MDREQKRKLRKELMKLLNDPNGDQTRIRELGKLLGKDERKQRYLDDLEQKKDKNIGARGPYKEKYVDPEQYIQWRKENKSRAEICEILGIDMRLLQSELAIMREIGLIKKGAISNKRPIKFTMTKEEFIKESAIKSDSQIAREYGVSRVTIAGKRREWKLPRKNKKITLTYEEFKELNKTLSYSEIEKKFGYTKGTIYRLKTIVWDMEEGIQ